MDKQSTDKQSMKKQPMKKQPMKKQPAEKQSIEKQSMIKQSTEKEAMEKRTFSQSDRLCQISWCALLLAVLVKLFLDQTGIRLESLLVFMPPCLFRSLTGFFCPGCGGTHAVLALLRGHVVQSFCYHPIVVYAAAVYGWYLISNTVEWISRGKLPVGSRYHRWQGIGAVLLVTGNFLLKNLMLLLQ